MRKALILLLLTGITFSCAPKRYKCGSGRRCHYVIEKNTNPNNPKKMIYKNT